LSIGDRFPHVLSAARDGADWAWAELYDDLAPTLLRFVTAMGAAEPEDCLGECFVQLVRNLPRFAGEEESFRTWAFRIARNRVIDGWRRDGRRPAHPVGDVVALSDRYTHQEAPDLALAGEDWVDRILGELTPDQRAVLLLRVIDQFSVEDTALVLGKSQGAVRVLQNRALNSLRRLLR
jgi:RNA polymerase sigma-70 factor (ECF subfamily)